MAGVAALLGEQAARAGDRLALVDDGGADEQRAWSWRALDGAARSVAAQLIAGGVVAGDRVALLAGNGAPFVAAWFGIAYAGAIVVPIPTVSAPPEVAQRLAHARCKLAIVDQERHDPARPPAPPP